MKNVKKLLAMLLVICMVMGVLAACGGSNNDPAPDNSGNAPVQNGEQNGEENQGGDAVVGDGPQYGGHLDVHTMYETHNID